MQSAYVYSGTYTNVLTARLLSVAQRELLLGSTTNAEVRKILQDTCFAPYLTEGIDIRAGLLAFKVAQKKLLERLAPEPAVLHILFLHYDYYNLKQIIIGKDHGLSDEEVLHRCVPLGLIEPVKLLQQYTDNTLRFDWPQMASVTSKYDAKKTTESLSGIVETTYLEHLATLKDEHATSSFIYRYITLTIDLYNITMRLRTLTHPISTEVSISGQFVKGGSFDPSDLETLDAALKRLERFGGATLWREAVEQFNKTKDFTIIDRTIDNYKTSWLKRESIEIHSPVSLFVYFESVLEHTQFIEAIVTAHNTGLSNDTLRSLLRNSIHSYAF